MLVRTVVARNNAVHAPNRRPVNMVFQQLALFPMMNVGENVEFGLARRGVKKGECRRRADAMLERVGLAGASHKRIDELSGGQRQRVAIARSLVLEPTLLLLDEPLAGLSNTERSQVKSLIASIPRETTVIMIEHDMDTALDLAETVTLLNYGRVIVDGDRDAVIADERTREVYLGA